MLIEITGSIIQPHFHHLTNPLTIKRVTGVDTLLKWGGYSSCTPIIKWCFCYLQLATTERADLEKQKTRIESELRDLKRQMKVRTHVRMRTHIYMHG